MAEVYFKMYYVGQGALNLLWVEDGDDIPYAAIFDAGTCSDPLRKKMESLGEVINIVNNAADKDAFITHMDADHYRLLKFMELDMDNFVLGSVNGNNGREVVRWINYFSEFSAGNVQFLPDNYIGNISAPYIPYPGVEICPFMANFGGEINDRCAVYGIRTNKTAVIVTGDMTGSTFCDLWNYNIKDNMKAFIGSRTHVITVPHHGALETLKKNNFVAVETSASGYRSYNLDNLALCIQNSGMDKGIFVASAGKHKTYKHPRQDVMIKLQKLSLHINQETQHYLMYRGQDEMLYKLLGGGWVSQWYADSKDAIYGTILDGDAYGNMAPGMISNLQKFSYEIRMDAPVADDDIFYIRAYDHRQRPVFEDIFRRQEDELCHEKRVYYKEGVRMESCFT